MKNQPLIRFIACLVILLFAFLSGFYGSLQWCCIGVLSALLYLIIFYQNKSILHHAIKIILSVLSCALLFYGCYLALFPKLICWFIGLSSLSFVVSYSFKNANGKCIKSVFTILSFVLLSLFTVGFNPFVGMKYSVKEHFKDYAYSRRGVYIIQNDSLLGLRDRWSVIEKPQYGSIEILNPTKPFVNVSSSEGIGVYNLETHNFDIMPTPRCSQIVQVNDTLSNMLDLHGNVYRQIIIPKHWWKELPEHQIKTVPFSDAEGNVSKEYIRDIAEEFEPNLDEGEEDFMRMYKQCPDSYSALGKIIRSSGCTNTPKNNLQWYYVTNDIIAETGMPKDSRISEFREIISWYNGGNQSELNQAAYMEQVLAHYLELEQFAHFLDLFPEQDHEYELFSMLQAQIIDEYISEMYEKNHYSSLPMDISAGIVNHLKEITELLIAQNSLLSGEEITVPKSINQSLDFGDVDAENNYKGWLEERNKFSFSLPVEQQRKYNLITKALKNTFNFNLCYDDEIYN